MADKQSIIRRIEIADKFRGWMESPEVTEYFDRAREQLIEAMLQTKQADDLGRFRLQVAVTTLDKFRIYLASSIADGKLAQRELEELRSGKRSFF